MLLIAFAHIENDSVQSIHHHLVINEVLSDLIDPTRKSPNSFLFVTLSQATQCIFDFSSYPPQRKHRLIFFRSQAIYMEIKSSFVSRKTGASKIGIL